ncbi:hypothetical protein BH24DEI1_BH24DEI1_05140 [soil metagenome]|jgi:hypothetical protein|nr:hypothetical protein [Deinococcota bacterium]
MEKPFGIKWKLAELLEREGATAAQLAETIAEHVAAETLRGWLSGRPEAVELSALGYLLWGLSQLSGRQYTVEDVLEYEVLIVGA